MLQINQIIRILIEKRADRHGLPDAHMEYLAKLPAQQTQIGLNDWERTRPVPLFDPMVAEAKWKAIKITFNWEPILHNVENKTDLKRCQSSK